MAQEAQHTPGEWKWQKHPTSACATDCQIVAPAGDAELGTWMIADRVRWVENARLIASAPTMLAALEDAANGFDIIARNAVADGVRELARENAAKLRAVLEKAKG
jgi:hypothetical protein